MPGPVAQSIIVTPPQQCVLEQIVRRHTSPQALVRRAQIILAAASAAHNEPIARRLGCTRKTVRTWRARWAEAAPQLTATELQPEDLHAQIALVLADAPRPGAPDTFTAEQIVQIIALACTPPADAARPTSHWSARELADEAVNRQIVSSISPRSIERFLKASAASATSEPLLAQYEGVRSAGLCQPG